MITYILGWVATIESFFLLLPVLVSVVYGEKQGIWYLLVAILSLTVGLLRIRKKPLNTKYYAKEGFVIVGFSWIILSIIGALPLTLSGDIPNYINSLFETVSGFTTTGASILMNVEVLSRCGLFWRSFTHFVGGMGVIVFLLIILPIFGGRNMSLMKAESPGPSVEKLVPHIRDTARYLYIIYISLTVTQMILLICFGMSIFDSITTAFATAGTGGFAIKNSGMASYSPAIQNIIFIFMILFGINFSFYFLIIKGNIKKAFKIEEVRWYLGIVFTSIIIITFNLRHMIPSIKTALQQACFQVASIITTTGFSTTDFNMWPSLSKTILVVLMFIGACASSTGGGLKVSRIIIMIKSSFNEIKKIINPRSINVVRIDNKPISQEIIKHTAIYFIIYIFIFAFSVLIISFEGHDLITNFTSVSATINNIGPGLNIVGPAGNYHHFNILSKIVLIFDMLAGRLELYPILVLLIPSLWKNK